MLVGAKVVKGVDRHSEIILLSVLLSEIGLVFFGLSDVLFSSIVWVVAFWWGE